MLKIEYKYRVLSKRTVNKQKVGISFFYPWLIWSLGAAFFLSEYFARIAPEIMVPELMATFKVNALSLGSLSGIFYTAYLGMQMPAGIIIDRYGTHFLLTAAATLCAIGCFLFASANFFNVAQIGRFLMGFGASFAFVGTLKLAAIWFPSTRFGLLSGLTQALGMIGAATAAGPLAFVEHLVGWRNTTWLIGTVLLLIALLIYVVVQEPKRNTVSNNYLRDRNPGRLEKKTPFLESFKIIFKNPQNWFNALYIGLVYAPTAGFAELWGTSYLVRVYNLDRTIAASAISCIFLGLAFGCPVMGWLSDKIKLRRPILFGAALSSLVFISCALYIPNLPIQLLFTFLFLYGIANSGFATSYAVAGEINTRSVAGISLGFANMASVLIGACFQPIIGWFLDLQWDGKFLNNAPLYSINAFRHAMMSLPICLIIGFLMVFFIKETHCRIKENS